VMTKWKVLLILLFPVFNLEAQECIGGNIATNEAFLYGRFEVSMQSARGNGVVSSFFLYNLDLGCNWPEENNEIDIEMTGDDEGILFTTHYPGPWYYTDSLGMGFDPHAALHDYAIEWEPGIVRWFVDGQLANVQDHSFVAGLQYPLRVIMNLWVSKIPSWVGVWDPAIMPLESMYDYVKVYEYTPGTGNYGTNSNFTPLWEESFDSLDTKRWFIEKFGGFDGNACAFKPSSVEFRNGKMFLQVEEEPASLGKIPVSFSLDASSLAMDAGDVIFLNGTFNNWCGNCEPLSETNGVWSTTIDLEPGKYEYLFSKNLWEETGGAPKESSCDFNPCDEYTNYGFVIDNGSSPLVLDTPCWGECVTCERVGLEDEIRKSADPQLFKVTDVLGRETSQKSTGILFFQYLDGRVERRFVSPD